MHGGFPEECAPVRGAEAKRRPDSGRRTSWSRTMPWLISTANLLIAQATGSQVPESPSFALPLVLRLCRGGRLPLKVPHGIGTALAQRNDVILDPTRAGPTGPAGRRTGIFLLEFLRHPAAAMVMAVPGSLGRCGGHDAEGHGHGGKELKHWSFHIWLEGGCLELPGENARGSRRIRSLIIRARISLISAANPLIAAAKPGRTQD